MKINDLKIIVLVDNCVFKPGLQAEHGFSLFIEKEGKKILFDCGQSSLLIENSKSLGVPLSDLDSIVLSHGHFDHTGGLFEVLKSLKKKVKIYAHPSIFDEKYTIGLAGKKYIGTCYKKETYESIGADFELSVGTQKVQEGVFTTGQIPRVTDFECVEDHFFKKEKNQLYKDEIWDDNSLIIENRGNIILVTGCAHAGIINILKKAQAMSNKKDFSLLIGGLHMHKKDNVTIKKSIKKIKKFHVLRIVYSHCSGINLFCELRKDTGIHCELGQVGKIINFD